MTAPVPIAPWIAACTMAALLALSAPALANGGTVRISRAPLGPWFVTVYSSPTPLRTGTVDISTLVQDSADVIMDVPIAVDAIPVEVPAEAGPVDPVRTEATRAQATNKLFKAAKFGIDVAGQWDFRIRVGSAAEAGDEPGDGPGGVLSFEAPVNRATILDRPFLLAVLAGLPLLVLGWLVGRGDGRGREDEGVAQEPVDGTAGRSGSSGERPAPR